jgi:hypothetical protein
VNTAFNLAVLPAVITEGVAVKELIAGAGTTVTVALAVAGLVPAGPVTVKVYEVVALSAPRFRATPLVTGRFPGVTTPEPPSNTAVREAASPAVIVPGEAVKAVMRGVWVGVPELLPPPPPQPTRSPSTMARVQVRGREHHWKKGCRINMGVSRDDMMAGPWIMGTVR